ncbi:MAG: hypothetical protein Q8M15_14065 [Bacteroidota bacterium]|nr:hypothetical protein [Bacteroidota bacterium]
MASTVKISKSKNLTFKKLSFLYLVFILFLFFSSAGQYVYQFPGLAVTQAELNTRLRADLNEIKPISKNELKLKAITLKACATIDGFLAEFKKYTIDKSVKGEKLRENNYVEKYIRLGAIGQKLDQTINAYLNAYHAVSNKTLSTQLFMPVDYNNKEYSNLEFYFKDSPNGVIPSIFEHFKTIFLYQTILAFNKEAGTNKKIEILTLEQSDFIQSFKKNLILGEFIDISIQSNDTSIHPYIKINNRPVGVMPGKNGISKVIYKPLKAGNYAVEISLGLKKVLTSFNVEGPSFRYIPKESNLKGEVGQPIVLQLYNFQMKMSPKLHFISNAAEISRNDNILTIIPKKEGKFEIMMTENGEILDKLSFFASAPNNPEVALMDISGQKVEFQNAHRLESVNTFWQVVHFDMILVQPGGTQNLFHCATRFLRNELRQAEASAPDGSTIIFNNIKLIGRDGATTTMGSPVVVLK